MPTDRRRFLARSAGLAALPLLGPLAGGAAAQRPIRPGSARAPRVITPDGFTDPGRLQDGVRIFHLVAEEVQHRFAPGLEARCYGYNGRVHGPTLEAVEGERMRIYVTNRLPVATTVHWHGIFVPSGMDGVGGLSHRPIEPGETFRYEFELRQHGTFMYHSHHDEMTQMALGLMGMIVVHPRAAESEPPARDYVYLLSEWALEPGRMRPDPNEMTDFNVLTFNARVWPATRPLHARLGDRVRIRLGNLSAMDHHPIHLHGHRFHVTATDGGEVPPSARWPETSVLVPVGAVRVIEFLADNPGDWAFHCHMTHHVMTQMGHDVPNLVGVDVAEFDKALARRIPGFLSEAAPVAPGQQGREEIPPNSVPMLGGRGPHGYVTMSGMFTILKVRESPPEGEDWGWYDAPPGTVAGAAAASELEADGIQVPRPDAPEAPRRMGHG
jgi:FtsP/CotA-like multicopper oxidase with cupredoxin domain